MRLQVGIVYPSALEHACDLHSYTALVNSHVSMSDLADV